MHIELLEQNTARESALRTPAHAIGWLVDNALAYDALLQAIDNARRSIWISQLAFDADCVAYDTVGDKGSDAHASPERRIVDALMTASTERSVDVCILLNASLLLDTAKPLRAFLAREGAPRVQVRGISRFPQLLHAKVVVIDHSEAFFIGSPFVNGYWDDARHHPADSRRPARELGGRPLHDVSCVIMGSSVMTIAHRFAEMWNDASVAPGTNERQLLHAPSHPASDNSAIRIVCTAPRALLPAHPGGLSEILPAIQSGLDAARSLVYIEHQYLSARTVVASLAAALKREPMLEIIVVLNQNPDVTAYRGWQNARLAEAGLLDHPRVGLFALWSAERSEDAVAWDLNQVFVHSKVLLIDDVWATVGSANLDGVSLHSYGDDFVGWPGRRVFRHVRNCDMNAVLDDSGGVLDGAVGRLREQLWAEHLAMDPASLRVAPRGGWLPLWRARAARNVAALCGNGRDETYEGFVLPHSARSTPRAQLADIGVPANDAGIRLHFNPGWLEVHCSPNWVRNMFL